MYADVCASRDCVVRFKICRMMYPIRCHFSKVQCIGELVGASRKHFATNSIDIDCKETASRPMLAQVAARVRANLRGRKEFVGVVGRPTSSATKKTTRPNLIQIGARRATIALHIGIARGLLPGAERTAGMDNMIDQFWDG